VQGDVKPAIRVAGSEQALREALDNRVHGSLRFRQENGLDATRNLNGVELENAVGAEMGIPPNSGQDQSQDPQAGNYSGSALDVVQVAADAIRRVGGDQPAVAALDTFVLLDGEMLRTPLFRVTEAGAGDGVRFVDTQGDIYRDMAHFRSRNSLPATVLFSPRDGGVGVDANGRYALEVSNNWRMGNSEAVNLVKSAVYVGGAAAALVMLFGSGGSAAPILLPLAGKAMGASMALGAFDALGELNRLHDLGGSLTGGRAINAYINLLNTGASGAGQVFRGLPTLRAGLQVLETTTDIASLGSGGEQLLTHWERMSNGERAASAGQLAFWGAMFSLNAGKMIRNANPPGIQPGAQPGTAQAGVQSPTPALAGPGGGQPSAPSPGLPGPMTSRITPAGDIAPAPAFTPRADGGGRTSNAMAPDPGQPPHGRSGGVPPESALVPQYPRAPVPISNNETLHRNRGNYPWDTPGRVSDGILEAGWALTQGYEHHVVDSLSGTRPMQPMAPQPWLDMVIRTYFNPDFPISSIEDIALQRYEAAYLAKVGEASSMPRSEWNQPLMARAYAGYIASGAGDPLPLTPEAFALFARDFHQYSGFTDLSTPAFAHRMFGDPQPRLPPSAARADTPPAAGRTESPRAPYRWNQPGEVDGALFNARTELSLSYESYLRDTLGQRPDARPLNSEMWLRGRQIAYEVENPAGMTFTDYVLHRNPPLSEESRNHVPWNQQMISRAYANYLTYPLDVPPLSQAEFFITVKALRDGSDYTGVVGRLAQTMFDAPYTPD